MGTAKRSKVWEEKGKKRKIVLVDFKPNCDTSDLHI